MNSIDLDIVSNVPKLKREMFDYHIFGDVVHLNKSLYPDTSDSNYVRFVVRSSESCVSDDIQDHIGFIGAALQANGDAIKILKEEFLSELSIRIFWEFNELSISLSISDDILLYVDRVDVSIV